MDNDYFMDGENIINWVKEMYEGNNKIKQKSSWLMACKLLIVSMKTRKLMIYYVLVLFFIQCSIKYD